MKFGAFGDISSPFSTSVYDTSDHERRRRPCTSTSTWFAAAMLFGVAGPAGVHGPLLPSRRAARRRGCRAGRHVRRKHNARVLSVSNLPAEHVTFACLNVRSLHNKTDDVIECFRDRRVDIFCLTETWHDADSACIGRLRTGGFNVVDRSRPRVVTTCQLTTAASLSSLATASPCHLSL